MKNIIERAITAQRQNISERLKDGRTTQDKLNSLSLTMDMEADEFVRFQELKTVAVASNVLTLEEGMTIYRLLGQSPHQFNTRELAVKVTLTELFNELLTGNLLKF